MRPRVYVSGPYSLPVGAEEHNTRLAIAAAQVLTERGFAPMVPHLSHFWQAVHPNPYDVWMEIDVAWVSVAQAVVRLPGESLGADAECDLARSLDIPVFDSVDHVWVGTDDAADPCSFCVQWYYADGSEPDEMDNERALPMWPDGSVAPRVRRTACERCAENIAAYMAEARD